MKMRIVSGSIVEGGPPKWMARLDLDGSWTKYCSGAVISRRYVLENGTVQTQNLSFFHAIRYILSAAHCFCLDCRYEPPTNSSIIKLRLPKHVKARIGSSNRYVSQGLTYKIEEIIVHPEYRPKCRPHVCSFEVCGSITPHLSTL